MAEQRTFADSVEFHLLGEVDFDQFLALQRRLAYDLGGDLRRRIVVLICEHRPLITVGRRGSREHIRLTGEQLRLRSIGVRWVSRGGGCVLHGPGQLAIYTLAPLERLDWSIGDYIRRFREGIAQTLASLTIEARTSDADWGFWGRSGQLAAMGIAVRNQVTQHGCFLNVNPSMANYRSVETPAPFTGFGDRRRHMGSLIAERSQGIRMTDVRAALFDSLSTAWGADRYHMLTGHPLMPVRRDGSSPANVRAS